MDLFFQAQEIDHHAEEQHGETTATTEVTITITDENDNVPKFSEDSFLAEVQENAPAGVPITVLNNIEIEVSDDDQVFI